MLIENNREDYNYILSLYNKQTEYILKELNYNPSKFYGYDVFKSIIYKMIDDKEYIYLYDIDIKGYKGCYLSCSRISGIYLYYIDKIIENNYHKFLEISKIEISPNDIDNINIEQTIIYKIMKHFEKNIFPKLNSYINFKREENIKITNKFLDQVSLYIKGDK